MLRVPLDATFFEEVVLVSTVFEESERFLCEVAAALRSLRDRLVFASVRFEARQQRSTVLMKVFVFKAVF